MTCMCNPYVQDTVFCSPPEQSEHLQTDPMMIGGSTILWRDPQDVALRLEPGTLPVGGLSDGETVPPAPMAAVLLVNAARWQLRDGSRSMAIVLRGLSLLVAQAEGAWLLCCCVMCQGGAHLCMAQLFCGASTQTQTRHPSGSHILSSAPSRDY